MLEKYYSLMHPSVEYIIKSTRIERKRKNFTMIFCYTDEYYNYIKNTCVRFYPKHEKLFLGYLKKIYNAFKENEVVYATEAWNRGIKDDNS